MQTATNVHSAAPTVMFDEYYSLSDALKHGYTLEESKARLTALIRKHFHPEVCE
jgi:hypothetical protein